MEQGYSRQSTSAWANKLGLAGLYTFSFFAFLGQAGSALGLLMMLVAILASFRETRLAIGRDPMLWVAAAFLGYLIIRAFLAAAEFPETAQAQWKEARDWGRFAFFLVIAWWMRSNPKRIFLSLLLALAGMAVHLVIDTEPDQFQRMLLGQRTGLAYPIGFMGILSGSCLVALLVFLPRILRVSKSLAVRVIVGMACIGVLALMLQLLITTQSRGSWLATGVSLCVAGVMWLSRGFSWQRIVMSGLVAAVLVIVGLQNAAILETRLHHNRGTIAAFLGGSDMTAIPFTDSAGARLHMWNFGLKRWFERPWFGWGPGMAITVDFSPHDFADPLDVLQAAKLKRHPHLHNGFLTMLSQLGIVGSMFFVAALYLVARQLHIAYKYKLLPDDLVTATSAILVLLPVSNLTSSRFAVLDFQILACFALSIAYTTRYMDWSLLTSSDARKSDASNIEQTAVLGRS